MPPTEPCPEHRDARLGILRRDAGHKVLEAFLAVVERVLPEHFLEKVTARRIFVKQPGSMF